MIIIYEILVIFTFFLFLFFIYVQNRPEILQSDTFPSTMNMFFNLMPMPVDMSDMKRRLDILQEKYHRMNDYSYDDKLFGVVRGKRDFQKRKLC